MLSDFFHLAMINLEHRRLRSWLTIIGIVIGIATISSLMSISQGMYQAIYQEFEMMGTNTIIILPGSGGSITPGLSSFGSHLRESDVRIIESVPGVDYALPNIYKTASIGFRSETTATFIYAVPSDKAKEFLESFHGVSIENGRSLRKGDKYKTVIGYRVWKDMFSDKVNVGRYITINGIKFRVVGVLSEIGNRMDDNVIVIPMSSAKELFSTGNDIDMIFIRVGRGLNVQKVADRIKQKLKDVHGKKDFQVLTSADMLKRSGLILNIISLVILGIAGISLFVGAIGIMNTMYMAVLERTREIGIMKAIGAQNSDVLVLFLVESSIIGTIGGLIGLAIGLGVAKLVEIVGRSIIHLNILQMVVTPEIILLSLLVSVLIGAISGILPARAAAKLNPVDALRYE